MSTISIGEMSATFGRIGLLSFGGPAGQIALMHKVLVEEKCWLGERQFLHALNFCMLLPGPEAMQLATYCGWLKRGVIGGLLAGLLFVLPGFAVLVALSAVYLFLGDVGMVAAALFGLRAAVLAIVLQALVKVAKRALKGPVPVVVAVAAFAALALLRVPFPLVVAAAALAGMAFPAAFGVGGVADNEDAARKAVDPWRQLAWTLAAGVVFWGLPLVALIALMLGSVFADMAAFFSKTAVVTFGGAYAVLAYAGQQAVETHHWLRADEMLTGLGLAETTPGPLILVLVFIGFIGAARGGFADFGFDPAVGGLLGALAALWFTFVPCFLWIFAGAPFMERLRGHAPLSGALAAITAAVVGVIANLSLWFALHVLFSAVGETQIGPFHLWTPHMAGFDWRAALIAALAGIMVFRGMELGWVLGVSILAGLVLPGWPTH